ncbi:MAG: DUF1566 domain-containing protein [Alphaproteobacteria bacterium]|nr:DUF1566 domain-containing protein [Alphaproteobacteria bacterium]
MAQPISPRKAAYLGLVFLGLWLLSSPALARTTATFGQKSVGEPCGNLASGTDFDSLVQCTSSAAGASGTMQTAPIILGSLTAPPYANVTCDSSKAGMLQWTGSMFQSCDGTSWTIFARTIEGTPAPFSFINQTNVPFNTAIISNAVILSGFTGTLAAACNAGCTGIYRNGIWIGVSGNFSSGDTIAIQLTSAPTATTATTATVRVGGMTSGIWTVTTAASVVITPDPFSFTNVTNVNPSATVTSNAVQLQGPAGTWTATCGAGCTNIAKNNVWLGTTATGFVAGNFIAIQQTAASTVNTARTAQVTVGSTTSALWMVTTAGTANACDGTPRPGTICADGTIYVGLSPDGNVKMYTTRCDAYMNWNGTSCIGARTPLSWNDGTGNTITTGANSNVSGRANTAALVALGSSPSPAPYVAANYCNDLTVNGHSDWYLPAREEIALLFPISNEGTANGFTPASYWSSTEQWGGAQNLSMRDGSWPYIDQQRSEKHIRCVRR